MSSESGVRTSNLMYIAELYSAIYDQPTRTSLECYVHLPNISLDHDVLAPPCLCWARPSFLPLVEAAHAADWVNLQAFRQYWKPTGLSRQS